jgi:hypothetical protein
MFGMADYYQRKALVFKMLSLQIRSLLQKRINKVDVDMFIDGIIEDPKLAVSAKVIRERFLELVNRYADVLQVNGGCIMRKENE